MPRSLAEGALHAHQVPTSWPMRHERTSFDVAMSVPPLQAGALSSGASSDRSFVDLLRAPYPHGSRRVELPAAGDTSLSAVIRGLLATLAAYDAHTSHHSMNVEAMASHLAVMLGVPEPQRRLISIGAMLHDIGKIGVPICILAKPAKLTREEFEIVKRHPAIGAKMLESIDCLKDVVPLVLYHHEWYDGSGYQTGLCGEEIPLGARIIQAADSIDAMISPRSYKSGFDRAKVISELLRGRGRQFDPTVADVAIRCLRGEPRPLPA